MAAVVDKGPQITVPPGNVHEGILQYFKGTTPTLATPEPSDHKMLISGNVLSWNILTKCSTNLDKKPEPFTNNGFGITENETQYKARLKWIAESIAETLAQNPTINTICLQEVPTNDPAPNKPQYLTFFQDELSAAIKNKSKDHPELTTRFPLQKDKNQFFHNSGPDIKPKDKTKPKRPPSNGRMTFFDAQEFSKCVDMADLVDKKILPDSSTQFMRVSLFELHPRQKTSGNPPQPRTIAHGHLNFCSPDNPKDIGGAKCIQEKQGLIMSALNSGCDFVGDLNVHTPNLLLQNEFNGLTQQGTIAGQKTIYFNPKTQIISLSDQTDAIIRTSKTYVPTIQPVHDPSATQQKGSTNVDVSRGIDSKLSADFDAQRRSAPISISPAPNPSPSQQGSNASIIPSPRPGSENEPLMFTGGHNTKPAQASESSTLDKKIDPQRGARLWDLLNREGQANFLNGVHGHVTSLGGKPRLSHKITTGRKGITITEEDPEVFRMFRTTEDKVDIKFDKIAGQLILSSRPDTKDAKDRVGTSNAVVLVASALQIAQLEFKLLIEDKLVEKLLGKKLAEISDAEREAALEQLGGMPPEKREAAEKEIRESIPEADRKQIFSFNISSASSIDQLKQTLQGMEKAGLAAKLSPTVIRFINDQGVQNDPTFKNQLQKQGEIPRPEPPKQQPSQKQSQHLEPVKDETSDKPTPPRLTSFR